VKQRLGSLGAIFLMGAVASVGWQVGQLAFTFWLSWTLSKIFALITPAF